MVAISVFIVMAAAALPYCVGFQLYVFNGLLPLLPALFIVMLIFGIIVSMLSGGAKWWRRRYFSGDADGILRCRYAR
jgi:hypothetical protein